MGFADFKSVGGHEYVSGGFDSHALPPASILADPEPLPSRARLLNTLLNSFVDSPRQGLCSSTMDYYRCYVNSSRPIVEIDFTCQQISKFLDGLMRIDGGKPAYPCRARRSRRGYHVVTGRPSTEDEEVMLVCERSPGSILQQNQQERRALQNTCPYRRRRPL